MSLSRVLRVRKAGEGICTVKVEGSFDREGWNVAMGEPYSKRCGGKDLVLLSDVECL